MASVPSAKQIRALPLAEGKMAPWWAGLMVVVCLSGRRDVVETETDIVDRLDGCGCQWAKDSWSRCWGSRLINIHCCSRSSSQSSLLARSRDGLIHERLPLRPKRKVTCTGVGILMDGSSAFRTEQANLGSLHDDIVIAVQSNPDEFHLLPIPSSWAFSIQRSFEIRFQSDQLLMRSAYAGTTLEAWKLSRMQLIRRHPSVLYQPLVLCSIVCACTLPSTVRRCQSHLPCFRRISTRLFHLFFASSSQTLDNRVSRARSINSVA
ncbi:hypothetical protein KC357_g211 [Hortaea werneckii]|nr:hypothetical protein KC357_g211 [Hortaea werneckii]